MELRSFSKGKLYFLLLLLLSACGLFKQEPIKQSNPYLKLLKQSNNAFKLDRFDSSVFYLDQCIELMETSQDSTSDYYPVAYAKRGDSYFELQNFKKARVNYMKAFEVSNEYNAYYIYDYFSSITNMYDSLALHDSLFYDSLLSPEMSFVKMYLPIDTMDFTGPYSGIIKVPLTKAHSFKDQAISLYTIVNEETFVRLVKLGEGQEFKSSLEHSFYRFTASDTSKPIKFNSGRHFIYSENYSHVKENDELAKSYLAGLRFTGTYIKKPMGYKMVISRDFKFYKKYIYDLYVSSLQDTYHSYVDSDKPFAKYEIKQGYYAGRTIMDVLQKATHKDIDIYLRHCNNNSLAFMEHVVYFPDYYIGWLLSDGDLDQEHIDHIIRENLNEKDSVNFERFGKLIESNKMVTFWMDQSSSLKDEGNFLQAIRSLDLVEEYAFKKNDQDLAHEAKLGKGELYSELGQDNLAKNLLAKCKKYFSTTNYHNLIERSTIAYNRLLDPGGIQVMVQAHHQTNFSLVHHPNGQVFYTAGWDGMLKKWDLKTQRIIIDKKTRHDFLQDIKISGDGKYLVAFDEMGLIVVYETYNLKEIWSLRPSEYLTDIDISNNGKLIAFLQADSNAYIVEWQKNDSLQILAQHSAQVTAITFDPSRNGLYTGSRDSLILYWNLNTKEVERQYNETSWVYSIALSPNGVFLAAVTSDTNMALWSTRESNRIGTLETTFHRTLDKIFFSTPSFSHDNLLLSMMSRSGSYLLITLSERKFRSFTNPDPGYVNQLAFHPKQQFLFSTDSDYKIKKTDLRTYERKTSQNIKSTYIENHSVVVYKNQFSNSGSKIHFLTIGEKMNVQEYDLKKCQGETTVKNVGMIQSEQEVGNSLITHKNEIYIEDDESENFKLLHKLPFALKPYCLNVEKKMIFGIYQDSFLRAYNYDKEAVVYSRLIPDSMWSYGSIDQIRYIPSTKSLVIQGHNSDILLAKSQDGELSKNSALQFDSRVEQFALDITNRFGILYSEKVLLVFDFKKNKRLWSIPRSTETGFISSVAIHSNGHLIGYGNQHARGIIYDYLNDDTLYVSEPFSWYIVNIAFNPIKPVVALTSINNYLTLVNYQDSNTLLTIYPRLNGSYITTIDSGYYWAPKNALNGITFKKGKQVYPVESFDHVFNRPDKILNKSPFVDGQYLKAIEAAVRKRKHASSSTPDIKNLPSLLIKNRYAIAEVVKIPMLKLIIETADFQSNIEHIVITVNGVPLYGSTGYAINPANRATTELNIELSTGNNRIAIWCVNEKGIQSMKENLLLYYSPHNPVMSNLYLVAISVSDYKNKDYDLKYAVKDGRDFIKSFDSVHSSYDNVFIDTLFNQDAVKENLASVADRLSHSSPGDKIIVFVSGHGLLDENYTFYFASYDCDFEKPAENGIPYTMIEGLFDNVAARQRVLLIDACHSGEVDKSEASWTQQTVQADGARGKVKVAYKGAIVKNKPDQVGLENSFELMKELFANIGDKGIQVISAAAGNSYALESDVWGNGVFTSSVLQAYKDNTADQNNDGRVSVSELRHYVIEEVYRLTNGRQRPTMRNENIEHDFNVW
jgi:WD40 repeat protein